MRGVYPKKNCPRFEKARRRRTQNLELREEYAYLQIWPGEKYSFHLKNIYLRDNYSLFNIDKFFVSQEDQSLYSARKITKNRDKMGQFNNFPAQATRKLTKSGQNRDRFHKFTTQKSLSQFFHKCPLYLGRISKIRTVSSNILRRT